MNTNICLVNNFNNDKFVEDCILSLLSQTKPFDVIIVVDDGSTDNSLEIIERMKEVASNIILLEKANGGQISALNLAREHISDQSRVFMLDSDDEYPPNYLQTVLENLDCDDCEFIFCEHHVFDKRGFKLIDCNSDEVKIPVTFRDTSGITRSRQCWIGNITSTISLSGSLYRRIFPYPIKAGEVLFADDVLIFASSILGSKKMYLPFIKINWRSHSENNSKKKYSEGMINSRKKSINRLIDFYTDKYDISRYPSFFQIISELSYLDNEWTARLGLPGRLKILNRLLRQKLLHYFF